MNEDDELSTCVEGSVGVDAGLERKVGKCMLVDDSLGISKGR